MGVIARLLSRLESTKSRSLVLVLLGLQLALHLKYLNLPPMGYHEWRQTQTLSVSRNFYEESMNIFEPRVDSRGSGSGISGMEFPLVNWIIAVGYKLFGYSYFVQRVILLLFGFVAIIGCYGFANKAFQSKAMAFMAALFLIMSPMFAYYSITALPDVPSLAFMFLSLWSWFEYRESGLSNHFFLALFFLLIAGLIKVYALIIAPVVALHILRTQKKLRPKLAALFALGATIVLVGAWYVYARILSTMHGNVDFNLAPALPVPLSVIPPVLALIFVKWLPGNYISYAEFLFFVLGVYVLVKSDSNVTKSWIVVYLLSLLAYIISQFRMFGVHDYYMTPALPLLIIITTIGFQKALQESAQNKWSRVATITLLIALPFVGPTRAIAKFERGPYREDLLTIEQHLDRIAPDKTAPVIVASDRSPSVYLYFMHRKGWSATEDVSKEKFEEILKNGAKYLVSDSRMLENRSDIKGHLKQISEHGKFKVFELRL